MKVGIVGAGCAGVFVADYLSKCDIDFVLFDIGKSPLERNHEKAEDLAFGIGGAGLFSDGKFSFLSSWHRNL